MPNGYLPPVVLDLLGDDSDLIRKIAEAKAAIASLDDEKAEPTADLNIAPLEAKVAEAEAELAALGATTASPSVTPHVNMAPALASIAAAAAKSAAAAKLAPSTAAWDAAMASGWGTPAGAGDWASVAAVLRDVTPNTKATQAAIFGAVSNVANLQAQSDRTAALLAAVMAQSDRAGASNAALGDAIAAASGAGGGRGGALLGALAGSVWGGGSNIPFLGGLAGFGSLGALAGLGPEHLAMTGVGIAGSAAGGLLGAGLLGLGAAGVAGVGMGTDLAGIGQAAGDIKTAVSDMNNLQQAIAVYGASSTQAQHAQALMNYHLAGFSQVARPAVVQAANVAQQFKAMFDQWTGPAEGTGAQIITQAMQVAAQFLPTIGKFAATNMVIIQQGLQPLFQWIGGPGLKIFQDLEQQFTNQLPTAMHALTQGFELIAKTIGIASGYTGGFIARLDVFLTRWNGVDFGRWQKEIGHLIGLFHVWWDLISIVAKDIYQIFHADAQTGTAIVKALTLMLTHLHTWLASTRGQAAVGNVFTVHRNEVLALLQVLPPLLKALGSVELIATPVMASLLTDIVKAIVPLINAISSIPGGAFVLGMAFLMRFGPLGGVLRGLSSIAMVPMAAGLTAIAKATGLMSAEGEVGFLGYVKGLGLLAAGLVAYEATTRGLGAIFGKPHPVSPSTSLTPQTRVFVRQYDASLAGTSPANLAGILGQPKPIVLPPPNASKFETFWTNLKHWLWTQWAAIDTDVRHWVGNIERTADHGWQAVDTSTRRWYGDVEQFIVRIWQGVYRDITHWAGSAYQFVDQAWQRVDTDTRHWFGNVEQFLGGVWSIIYQTVSGAAQRVYQFLDSIWQRVDTDARHWFGNVEQVIVGIWQTLSLTMRSIWGSISLFFSTQWHNFVGTAHTVWTSVVGAITGAWSGLTSGAQSVWSKVSGFFTSGVNDIIGIINFFIRALNNIPGVKIAPIGLLGGAHPTAAARAGAAGIHGAASGGITSGPAVLVGEGRGQFPEFIIPTDPAHRARALGLTSALLGQLTGMAGGGIFGGITSGLSSIAGAVTSGATHILGLLGSTLLGPAFAAATKGLDAAMGHLPFPINDLGKWAASKIVGTFSGLVKTVTGATAGSLATAAGGSNAANQALGQQMAAAMGWTGAQWAALNAVVMRESGWSASAQNPTSTAFGIAQNIGGPAGYGAYGTSPAGQIAWLLQYIAGRYKTPAGAWQHELSAGWYDGGGFLPTGMSLALNTTGRPEPVGAAGHTITNHITMNTTADPHTVSNDLAWILGRQLAGLGH